MLETIFQIYHKYNFDFSVNPSLFKYRTLIQLLPFCYHNKKTQGKKS